MIRKSTFSWLLLPMALALTATSALASPVITHFGNASVTIAVSPDPPVVGSNAVTVQIAGATPSALNGTTVRYATLMPSMNMQGPSGIASRVPGSASEWRFNAAFGMAAPWTLHVQLSGGISGSVDAHLTVGQASQMSGTSGGAQSKNAVPNTGSSSDSMASMGASGDTAAWHDATFALIVVLVIGALVLWRNRRPLTIALVVIAALVVVGLAYAQSRYGSSSADMSTMQSAPGAAPVPVTLARVGKEAGTTAIQAPASVQPYLVQNIVARAPGVLSDFTSYTGDHLKAGDIIARLQEPELQSNAQAAAAAAQAAQNQRASAQDDVTSMQANVAAQREKLRYWSAEIARERSLLNAGAVSVQEYQDERAQAAAAQSAYGSALAKVAGAKASANAAQAQVEQAAAGAQSQDVLAGYANVIVPNDSVVMKRLVDPGVYVQPGTPILQVAVVNRLRIRAQVAQQDLAGIEIGTPIDVTFNDGRLLHSRISSVSPVVDPATHTAIAEAIVPNAGDFYQPGGFVNVVLHPHMHTSANTFSVPSGAIVGGASTAVWVDLHGSAHRVLVSVISDDGTTAQVTGDLRPDTRVVVTGASGLEEGEPIAESTP